MKTQQRVTPENVERALNVLHAVVELYSVNHRKKLVGASDGSETLREEYLTVRQLAERIKYGEQTVRNMMSAGVFRRGVHYYKRRGRVLFLWSRIEEWLQESADTWNESGTLRGPVIEQGTVSNEGDEPFYPVHHARSRKGR